jgi:hypothetical protein
MVLPVTALLIFIIAALKCSVQVYSKHLIWISIGAINVNNLSEESQNLCDTVNIVDAMYRDEKTATAGLQYLAQITLQLSNVCGIRTVH